MCIRDRIKLEEDEIRREQDQIAREEQREEIRKQREEQKRLDDKRYRDREDKREEQKRLDDKRYRDREDQRKEQQGNEEERRQKQDTLLSIIGATTIPIALISGLMGMNTDLEKCGRNGLVPCLKFYDVIGVCILLGIAIFFTYRYILKRNSEK